MVEQKNGVAESAAAGPAADIVKQVEYYFGDLNLSRDKFLLGEIEKADGGWIDMATMMKFNRLAKLVANNIDAVLDALEAVEETGLMEVDREATRIRRKPSRPLPTDRAEYMSSLASRTAYVKGFDKDAELVDVEKILVPHGPIESIFMRRWKGDDGKSHFKGSIFATFPDVAAAEKFLALPEVKAGDTVLEKKWKNDWALEKEEEVRARREKFKQKKLEKKGSKGGKKETENSEDSSKSPPKKRKLDDTEEGSESGEPGGEKKAKTDGGEAAGEEAGEEMEEEKEEEEDECGIFPGSVFKLQGIPKEGVHVRDLRSVLEKYEKQDVEVAYVIWESGNDEAIVRLKERDTAKKALETIRSNTDLLKVKDSQLTVAEMGDEEETKLLTDERERKKEAQNKQRNRSKNTRGGGRGRGGRGRGHGRGRRGRGRGRR